MHASTIFNFESLAQIFAHPELAVFHPWISSQFVGRTRKISFSKKKYASRSNPFDAKIVLGEKSDSPSDKRQQKFGKEMGSKWVNVLHTMSGKSLSENDSLDLMNVKSSFTSIEEYSSNEWDIKLLRQGPEGLSNVISCLLYLFCSSYSHLLLVLDDREFYDKQVPFTLEKQRKIAASLNTLVYNSLSWSVSPQYRPLVESAVRCLHLLYERDCRHQFCPPDLLLSPGKNNRLPVAVAARIYEVFSSAEGRPFSSMGPVITTIPHVFPFEESESGLPESGLDYGGLSEEFLTDISKAAFSPEYGLFSHTSTSERLLIPNTTSRFLDNGVQMIEFLGRIVGKALYEGILLDFYFSHVFVRKLLGRYSYLDELSTLDPELHRNFIYVKHYDDDASELSLDFTVMEKSLGKQQIIELKPGGKDIFVTNENKLQYVHAMADYKLNRQILSFSNAFYRGLSDLISPFWLKLFNASEFNQVACDVSFWASFGGQDVDRLP